MQLSAVLYVEDVLVAEHSENTEFHADCLAQGLFGDLFPVQVYDCTSNSQKIDQLRGLLQPGNLLRVHNGMVDVCCNALRLMGPDVQPFSGDCEGLRRGFESKQTTSLAEPPEHPLDDHDHLHGNVTECRILMTQCAGPMAFATIETATGIAEAILFPSVFERYQSIISRLGPLTFSGKMEPGDNFSVLRRFIVKEISQDLYLLQSNKETT